jgi:hypothetical protein
MGFGLCRGLERLIQIDGSLLMKDFSGGKNIFSRLLGGEKLLKLRLLSKL